MLSATGNWKGKMEQLTFDPPEKKEGELIFSLTLPGRLPSWNEILGMQHWSRHTLKNQLASVFLYELNRSANDCSTKTICAASTLSIYAVTLASYLQTRREQRRLRSAKKKPIKVRRKKSKSKFIASEPVPF